MTIRRIRPEDALAVKDLRLRALKSDPLSFGSTYEREVDRPDAVWLALARERASSDDRATFLAFDGDHLVGLAVTGRDEKRGDVFGVYSVWVAPTARRRGIATLLMAALEPWAIDQGGSSLELLVSDAAPSARRLYERAGFVTDGRVEASPHAGVTEHGMTKRLVGAGRMAAVYVVPYDAGWPSRFEEERELLQQSLAPWLVAPIEHIGSTAVPGLAAKPVIDLMAPVASLESSRPALRTLGDLGYVYFPYRKDVMHWLCKPSDAFRTHHLHVVPFGGELWTERIAFRDLLRGEPEVAAEYAVLKRELAERHRFDREKYTDEKEPFVRRVIGLAAKRRS